MSPARPAIEPEPTPSPGTRASRARALPTPGARRATVIGAGSFGTAVAVLLVRGGLRTTLQARTAEQSAALDEDRENKTYLPGSSFRASCGSSRSGRARARGLRVRGGAVDRAARGGRGAEASGMGDRAAVVSLAKGLVAPDGESPTTVIRPHVGPRRTACVGGPAHAHEMVSAGAGLVAASSEEALAKAISGVFIRAGVVCEESNDPIGVELAGAAKNAAALASGATEAQGLNAAGAAAGHIFAEVWRYAEGLGARPESFIGLAGTGDLVATALAPKP